jgi:hypothetical protein
MLKALVRFNKAKRDGAAAGFLTIRLRKGLVPTDSGFEEVDQISRWLGRPLAKLRSAGSATTEIRPSLLAGTDFTLCIILNDHISGAHGQPAVIDQIGECFAVGGR